MFDAVLIGLAVLCAAYFLVIVLYAGMGTSFAFIWLFFAALCLFLVYGRWYYARNAEKIPRWIPVSVATTCIAGLAVTALLCLLVFLGAASSQHRGLDYVIVLGARVKENGISRSLQNRLDRAIEYAQENPDTMLVLSGGKGANEPVSEAMAMRDYLVYNGVRPEQLLLEDRSTSTVENIAFSKAVIDRYRMEEKRESDRNRRPLRRIGREGYLIAEDKPLEIGVLTSNFHVYRAKGIARHWGFENVYGLPAASDPILFVHFCVRECASIVKDRIVGNM